MKTAITVLQEMMIKQGLCPEYEFIAQTGPQHQALFEYRCSVLGVTASAVSRSKKEAKQEAARVMLLRLEERGQAVPPPYCRGGAPMHFAGPVGGGGAGCGGGGGGGAGAAAAGPAAMCARSYVALLGELCEEYRLPGVKYELTADTGPPHARHFTMSARLGLHERHATSTTKKAARQLAAEQLYTYLKENLSRVIKDFVEDEALARAHARAMERYVETREEMGWRPHLGQRVADYHLGLRTQIDEEKQSLALTVLEALVDQPPEMAVSAVSAAAAALGLGVEWHALPAAGGELALLELSPTSPPLVTAGRDRCSAAAAALRYLRRALAHTHTHTHPSASP